MLFISVKHYLVKVKDDSLGLVGDGLEIIVLVSVPVFASSRGIDADVDERIEDL